MAIDTSGDPQAGILAGPGQLELDLRARTVTVGDQPVVLTRLGFEVLRVLLSHRGETVTNDELARSVWGHQATPDAGFVQTAVYRLRAALRQAGAGDIIENVRGVGYAVRGTRPDGDALLTRQVLETVARGLSQPLMVLDSHQRIVLANETLAALSGYQVAELESLPTSAVLWPGDGQTRRQGQFERLFGGQTVRAPGEHLERRDRTVVTIDLVGRPILIEGRVIGAILECSPVS